MSTPSHPITTPAGSENIDIKKVKFILRNNRAWIIGIVIITNLTAYLIMRWTKDSYTSEAEMKLDIKRDAIDIGINVAIEPPNLDIIAGEIEQIKSKVFLGLVIDSLHLDVSYFSVGHVLKDEKYKCAPIAVVAESIPDDLQDIPIYFKPIDAHSYQIEVDLEQGNKSVSGMFGSTINLEGLYFTINKTVYYDSFPNNNFSFVLNSRKELFDYFSENLLVEPLNINANTIKIALQDHNVTKAHSIVSKITSWYIKYRNDQKNLSTKQKIEWLSSELIRVEDTIKSFEDYFEKYTLQNKSSNIYEDVKRIAFHLNKIDSQHVKLQKKINEVDTLIEQLSDTKSFSWLYPISFFPSYLNKKIDALQELLQQQNKIELSYKKNTRTFKQKEDELNALRQLITYQIGEVRKKWREDIVEMNRKKALLEKEFLAIPERNTRFSKNQRLYTLYEDFYLSVIQSKAQFEITQAGNTPDFKILSPATLPDEPTIPIKSMILGGGAIASLIFGFLLVGTLYLLYDKIISNQTIEQALSVPILGSIPISLSSLPMRFIIKESPKSIVSEAIRTLRTSLGFFTDTAKKKIITISSTIPGEGKSFLALNLSASLAFSGKKVVLLDLDMRKGSNNEWIVPRDPRKGISTILIKDYGWKDCIVDTEVENMSYIPAGPNPPNPSELLLGDGFTQLLADLRAEYEFIVLDTPPAGLVTDGIIAMKKSDISIYMFKINYSKKAFLEIFNNIIRINKIKNVAIVTNALPSDRVSYYNDYYEKNASDSS